MKREEVVRRLTTVPGPVRRYLERHSHNNLITVLNDILLEYGPDQDLEFELLIRVKEKNEA